MDELNEAVLENGECVELENSTDSELENDISSEEVTEESKNDEISMLRAELDDLRAKLLEKEQIERAESRMQRELSEFEDYFPEVSLEEIPDEVWQKVKVGASLSAQYSLFRRRAELEKRRISDFNEKNRKMSAGAAGHGEGEKYYSPAEVKRMSPAQVKTHYDEIIESMRHWN